MGTVSKKAKGKAEVLSGTVERVVGKALGKKGMEAEGAATQVKGKARQAAAKVVAKARGAIQDLRRAAKGAKKDLKAGVDSITK